MRTNIKSNLRTISVATVAASWSLHEQCAIELEYFLVGNHCRVLKEVDCGNIGRLLVEKECLSYGNPYYEYHILEYGLRRCFGGLTKLFYEDAKNLAPKDNGYESYEEAYAHI